MKTCPECGTTYTEDECPFCEKEKYWQKLYKLVDALYEDYVDDFFLNKPNNER